MKKRLLAVLLPVIGGAALAGTGFGAWVFTSSVESKTAYANMEITPAVEVTGFAEVTNYTGTIKFDQANQDVAADATAGTDAVDNKLGTIAYTLTATVECTDGAKIDEVTGETEGDWVTGTQITLDQLKANLSFDVTVTNGASAYAELESVSVGTTAVTANSSGVYQVAGTNLEWTKDDTVTTSNKYTVTGSLSFVFDGTSTFDGINDLAGWKTMKAALADGDGAQITLSNVINVNSTALKAL